MKCFKTAIKDCKNSWNEACRGNTGVLTGNFSKKNTEILTINIKSEMHARTEMVRRMFKLRLIKYEREEILLYILNQFYGDRLGSVQEKDMHKKVFEFISKSKSPLNYKFIKGSDYPFSYDMFLDINRLVARGFLKEGPMEFVGNSIIHSYEISESGRIYASRIGLK